MKKNLSKEEKALIKKHFGTVENFKSYWTDCYAYNHLYDCFGDHYYQNSSTKGVTTGIVLDVGFDENEFFITVLSEGKVHLTTADEFTKYGIMKIHDSLSKDSNRGSKDDIDEYDFLKDKAFFLMIKNGKTSLAHLIPPLYKETVDLANKLIGENFFVLKDDEKGTNK